MANRKTKEELEQAKQIAKDYWLYTNYTQKDIAERLDVAEQTIMAWRKESQWDKLKEGLLKIADRRFDNYIKLLDLFSNELSNEKVDVDKLTKLQSLIERNSIKNTEPGDIEKVGLGIIRYLDEVMPEKRDFYLSFYRSFAEWYSQKK
ncbi:MAG: hypothetical protein Fur0027_14480 [Raineya sp.]